LIRCAMLPVRVASTKRASSCGRAPAAGAQAGSGPCLVAARRWVLIPRVLGLGWIPRMLGLGWIPRMLGF